MIRKLKRIFRSIFPAQTPLHLFVAIRDGRTIGILFNTRDDFDPDDLPGDDYFYSPAGTVESPDKRLMGDLPIDIFIPVETYAHFATAFLIPDFHKRAIVFE